MQKKAHRRKTVLTGAIGVIAPVAYKIVMRLLGAVVRSNTNNRVFSFIYKIQTTMAYGETKVYFDGSHYIAIPHTECPKRYRPKPVEEKITVVDDNEGSETVKATEPLISPASDGNDDMEQPTGEQIDERQTAKAPPKNERQMSRKELFEELYKKYIDLPRAERHYKVMDGMEPYFDTIEQLKWYVDLGFERKHKNLIYKRIRMTRKANLAGFNYFCTFTYSDAFLTE